MYAVDLPNDAESAELLQRVLEGLNARFGTDAVKVDRKNFNASRIFKAWGTTARKGDHTDERPHRMSRLLEAPETIETVPAELLRAVAAAAPTAERPSFRQTRHTFSNDRVPAGPFDVEAFGKSW